MENSPEARAAEESVPPRCCEAATRQLSSLALANSLSGHLSWGYCVCVWEFGVILNSFVGELGAELLMGNWELYVAKQDCVSGD